MSLGSRGYLIVWDLKEGKQLRRADGKQAYRQVAFTPNGQKLVAASYYEVDVWDLAGWNRTSLGGHWSYIGGIAISQSGKMLAVTGRMPVSLTPPGIVVYDLPTGKILQTFRGTFMNAIAFSPDSSLLAAAGDSDITLWNTRTWNTEATLSPPVTAPKAEVPITIRRLNLLNNADYLAVDVFTQMHIWDRRRSKLLWSVPYTQAAVSSDGRKLATVIRDSKTDTFSLALRELPAEAPVASWDVGRSYPEAFALSSDATLVSWGTHEKNPASEKVFVFRMR